MGDTIDRNAPAVEDTFILSGQPYVYTEQDWELAPGAANEAFVETRSKAFEYMGGLWSRRGVIEDDHFLSREELTARACQLVGGMYALLPYVDVARMLRRGINALLITQGITFSLDH